MAKKKTDIVEYNHQLPVPELPASMVHLAPYFTKEDKIAYSRLPAEEQKKLEQLKPAQWEFLMREMKENKYRFFSCTVIHWVLKRMKEEYPDLLDKAIYKLRQDIITGYYFATGKEPDEKDKADEKARCLMYCQVVFKCIAYSVPYAAITSIIPGDSEDKANDFDCLIYIAAINPLVVHDLNEFMDEYAFLSAASFALYLQPRMAPDTFKMCKLSPSDSPLLAVEIVAVFHHVYRNLGNSINLNWWRAIYRVLHERGYLIASSPEAFINYMVKYKKEMQLMAEYFELADKSLMSPDKWVLNDKGSPAVDKSPFKASGNGSCPYYQLTPWKQWQTDYNERKPATRSNSAAKASLVKDFGDDDKLLDSMLCVAENLDKILHFFYPEEEGDMKPD